MDITINQHYVPKMYIKRFGYGTEDKPKISVLKKHEKQVMHDQNPDNFASKRFFYDTSEDVIENVLKKDLEIFPFIKESEYYHDEQLVEHAFSRVEGQYRKLLDQIEANPRSIYEDECRAVFIHFIHSLAYRTKSFRDSMDYINTKTENFLNKIYDNMGVSEEVRRRIIDDNCTPDINTQLGQILSLQPILDTMERLVTNYDWYIGYNDTELNLIISDNPAQMVRIGFNDICIPVSKNRAIVMRAKEKGSPMLSCDEPDGETINMSTEGVIKYNAMQIAMAQMYVFGSKAAINIMNDLLLRSEISEL